MMEMNLYHMKIEMVGSGIQFKFCGIQLCNNVCKSYVVVKMFLL